MKYTTPSIEVVNFSSADAPRIGMQWWYSTGNGVFVPAVGYAGPTDIVGEIDDLSNTNLSSCSNVQGYTCRPETALPSDAAYSATGYAWIADDHQSC